MGYWHNIKKMEMIEDTMECDIVILHSNEIKTEADSANNTAGCDDSNIVECNDYNITECDDCNITECSDYVQICLKDGKYESMDEGTILVTDPACDENSALNWMNGSRKCQGNSMESNSRKSRSVVENKLEEAACNDVPRGVGSGEHGRCVYSSLSSLVSAYIKDKPNKQTDESNVLGDASSHTTNGNMGTGWKKQTGEMSRCTKIVPSGGSGMKHLGISHYKSQKAYVGNIDFDMVDGPTKLVVSVPKFHWNGDVNSVWKVVDNVEVSPCLEFQSEQSMEGSIKLEAESEKSENAFCDDLQELPNGTNEKQGGDQETKEPDLKLEESGKKLNKEDLFHKVIGPKAIARETKRIKGREKALSLYRCNMCGHKSTSTGQILVHIRSHTGERPYQCKVCSKCMTTKQGLHIHMRTHTGEKPYMCHFCNKCFTVGSSLKGHLSTHMKEQNVACPVCGKMFSNVSNMSSHMRIHSDRHPYKCDICSKTFKFTTNLRIHMRTHTGEKPYMCNICSKRFSQATHLKTHKRTHTGELPYRCKLCDKEFSQSSHMRTHMSTHTGERMCSCEVCGKSLANKRNLRIHMRTHTGEQPFKCSECGKGFSQTPPLRTHMKLHHTGEKPYQCEECDKAFAESSMLKVHQRTHTGEKPYKCIPCEKEFAHAASLKYHEKKHHLSDVKLKEEN